jgi:hypothetical protein
MLLGNYSWPKDIRVKRCSTGGHHSSSLPRG